MELVKCNLNPGHLAVFTCKCSDPPAFLCLACLEKHTESGSGHQIFSLSEQENSSDPPQPTSSTAEVCSCCRSNKATELCYCTFPVVLVCRFCKIVHMSKDAGAFHSFVQVGLKEKLKSEEDVFLMKQRLMSLNIAECKLRQNISEIAKCEEKFHDRCSVLKSQLQDYRDKQLEPIHLTKNALLSRLKQDSSKDMQESGEKEGLEEAVREYVESGKDETLKLFQYEERQAEVDMQRVFGIYWESRLEPEGTIAKDFSTPNTDQALVDILKSLEPLLAFPTEEKYLSSFTHYIEQIPSLTPEEVQRYTNEARVHYFKEHFACAKARDSAISEAITALESGQLTGTKSDIVECAKNAFQQRIKTKSESLAGKYRDGVGRALEGLAEARAKTEAMRKENEDYKAVVDELQSEGVQQRGIRGWRRRSRRGRSFKDDRSNRRNSAFQLFCHSLNPELKVQLQNESKQPGSYLKSVSRLWKSLSDAEREAWKERAMAGVALEPTDFGQGESDSQYGKRARSESSEDDSGTEPWRT